MCTLSLSLFFLHVFVVLQLIGGSALAWPTLGQVGLSIEFLLKIHGIVHKALIVFYLIVQMGVQMGILRLEAGWEILDLG